MRTIIFLFVTFICFVNAGSNDKSKKYLAEKAGEEGVVSLPSGLMYKVLRKGEGAFHPKVDAPCEVHYAGRLIDGTEFDSSYSRGSPTTFAPNQVIKGWTEAMQLMVEGDKWEMYIPSELGYGDRGSPPKIGGGDALIFIMEILQIKGDKVPANTCKVDTLEGCSEKETKYINKMKAKPEGTIPKEIKRLTKMKGNQMKPSLKTWLQKRLLFLSELNEPVEKKEL